jgi:small-conductance mechanosensitive channel
MKFSTYISICFLLLMMIVSGDVVAQNDATSSKTEASSKASSEKPPFDKEKSKDNKDTKTAKDSKDSKANDKSDKTTDKIAEKDVKAEESKPLLPLGFEALVKGWEAQLNDIEAAIGDVSTQAPEILEKYRSDLRAIRGDAQEENRVSQELLDSKRAMLTTLGEPPAADAPVQEDKKIIGLRKQLNDEIASADAKVKRTSLVAGRAQKILDDFSYKEQAEIRTLLMTRGDSVYSSLFWSLAAQEYKQYKTVTSPEQGRLWVSVSIVIALGLMFLHGAVVTWLNAWNEEVQLAKRRIPFLLATLSTFLLLGLRLDVLKLQMFPSLMQGFAMLLTLTLCGGFWRMLTGMKFEDAAPSVSVEEDDARGYRPRGYWRKVWQVSRLATIIAVPLVVFGYVNLASYFLVNLYVTLFTIALFVIARRLVTLLMRRANGKDKEYFSVRHIIILEPVMVIPFAVIALYFWGVTPEVVQNWLDKYSAGIPIGNIVLDIGNIASALAVLITLIYLTRLIQWFIGERVMVFADVEPSVRNTVYSITGYVGHSVAILTALGTLGIDMSNLAIVAGALSVGIGFGLQAIFNNFVSGLILLLERPVRVGDWVQVGAIEGNVSRIRVRATEIKTFQNALVIVPNSMLITEQVMNWTLNDAMGRVEIKVGVAYGSDLQLVKKLILRAAMEHSEVRRRPEIRVFMMDFGESAIAFELRCFIKNIENRLVVMSDLRFKIDELFRQHNITIPYPQRVVHTHLTTDEPSAAPADKEKEVSVPPAKSGTKATPKPSKAASKLAANEEDDWIDE